MALVLFEKVNEFVGKITLNDPDSLNAMSEGMAAEFASLVKHLGSESKPPRAIVLTGAGRAFSAGGNLEMLEAKTKLSTEENKKRMLDFYHSFLGILDLNIPLVAAINGHAVGAGLCLASACDIRIAAEDAKLGFTFAKLGLHPGMGATYFLPRIVGTAKASELLMTGKMIEAKEALEIGLVSKLVRTQDVLGESIKFAEEIKDCGPLSVRQLCQALRRPILTLKESLEYEATSQAANYASAEFKEGINAAREKRKPTFSS